MAQSHFGAQNGIVRSDRRCGQPFADEGFRLPNGALYECDPDSERPCCSNYGWCGGDADHCACDKCVDFRPHINHSKINQNLTINQNVNNNQRSPKTIKLIGITTTTKKFHFGPIYT